jgi:antitoxin VapB
MESAAMTERKRVRLFRCGRYQAVRIPIEFELASRDAFMRREGNRLVIKPVRKRGLLALLKTMKPLEESFPEIEDIIPPAESPL